MDNKITNITQQGIPVGNIDNTGIAVVKNARLTRENKSVVLTIKEGKPNTPDMKICIPLDDVRKIVSDVFSN